MPTIYRCEGRRLKISNSQVGQVLENPNENRPILVNFEHDSTDLIITITGFVSRLMQSGYQENRGEFCILQEQFKPVLPILDDLIKSLDIKGDQEQRWLFGYVAFRAWWQEPPKYVKLAEVRDVNLSAPFDEGVFEIRSAVLVIDSNAINTEQKERQIHFEFHGTPFLEQKIIPEAVVITVPLSKLENNFIKPIQKNWVA